jgi:mono/diheme cytochrome c family protein
MKKIITISSAFFLFLVPTILLGLTSLDEVELGKAVYMKKCKMCHGADGNGNPAMARMLSVEFKSMSSVHIQSLDDESIAQTIKKGKGKMAKVRNISDEDIAHVISYLRTLKED